MKDLASVVLRNAIRCVQLKTFGDGPICPSQKKVERHLPEIERRESERKSDKNTNLLDYCQRIGEVLSFCTLIGKVFTA